MGSEDHRRLTSECTLLCLKAFKLNVKKWHRHKITVDKIWPEDIPSENKENKNSDYWEERGRRKRNRELGKLHNFMYQSRKKKDDVKYFKSMNIYTGILLVFRIRLLFKVLKTETLRCRKLFLRNPCVLLVGM